MTPEEKALLDLTAELWNRFCALPDRHSSDSDEMARDIHNIQNRIMARIAARADPGYFRR